jgi:hypothetical protein
MSEHCAYVVQISELRKHSNADRLQIATIFSQSVIVDMKTKVGDLGIYFPTDLQLSEEYCNKNNLVRRFDENGNNVGGYLDPNKRNIRAMKLRGEKSEGLFMPLESLAYTGETKFSVGDKIDVLNGHEICKKYIPRGNTRHCRYPEGNRTRKHHAPISPLFMEHADTEQLVYNMDAFHPGDLIEITLKMHGTSGRTGYLPKLTGYKRTFIDKLFGREGTPIYDWGYVTGTRRTVINDFNDNSGYYGSNVFREAHAKAFEGKLYKGETAYYEIVGFTDTGAAIMPQVKNNKISDKEFTKQYGEITTFSYGCSPDGKGEYEQDEFGNFTNIRKELPQSDMYVYRMTMTNEDGDVVEYTPDFMRYRCEQMGIKCVPVLWQDYIPNAVNDEGLVQSEDFLTDDEWEFSEWILKTPGEYIKDIAEQFYDGPDPVGKTHVREGVVIRIVNRPKFCAYKHKNFSFKVLEGIAKDLAAEPDMEEAQEEADVQI